MAASARALCALSTLAVIAATWFATATAHAEAPTRITFDPSFWLVTEAPRVQWIAASPWDDQYRPPLADIRALVSPDSPKYGPEKWTSVSPVFVQPETPVDPNPVIPDPPSEDWSSGIEWLDDGADFAWMVRQLTPSSPGIDDDYDFDYDTGLEFGVYLRDDRDEGIEIAYFSGDMTVEDSSSGTPLFATGTLRYLRISYVTWEDRPRDGGFMGSFGSGWLEEHVSSNRDHRSR
jgi:hypothetical protein